MIALFPVFVILINSFKTRKAIFREPLALPDADSFSLIGYQTVMKQGDFFLYFQNSLIVTVASLFFVLLFGAMAAFALAEYRFRGNTLMGLYLALGIMIPIRHRHRGDPRDDGGDGAGEHALGADPRLHRARAAAGGLHPVGIHAPGVGRSEKRRPDRRAHANTRSSSAWSLPLVRPAMATVAVFNMIPIWNDLWFPLILAPAEETKTLTLGSQVFIGQFVTDWNAVLSALSWRSCRCMILYVIFSRQLIRGITSGAVK